MALPERGKFYILIRIVKGNRGRAAISKKGR